MFISIIFLYFFYLNLIQTNRHDFCNRDCQHIACCHSKSSIIDDCVEPSNVKINHSLGSMMYPATTHIVHGILDTINRYRNNLACSKGNYVGSGGKEYPPASDMDELEWDWELAYLSQIYTSRCILGKPFCTDLEDFPSPGSLFRINNTVNPLEFIEDTIEFWWEGHKKMSIKNIYNYKPARVHRGFPLLSMSNQTHIGCSLSRCKSPEKSMMFMMCHLSHSIHERMDIYIPGKSASSCHYPSKNYACLCKAEEHHIEAYAKDAGKDSEDFENMQDFD